MEWSNARMLEQWPGQEQGQSKLRGGAAESVQRTLRWGGVLSLLRLAVLPWLIILNGYKYVSPITHEPIIVSAVGMGVVFLLCGATSRVWPMMSVLFASAVFGAWCWYDFQQHSDLIEAGIIGKAILCVLLIWAFMQAMMSRTL